MKLCILGKEKLKTVIQIQENRINEKHMDDLVGHQFIMQVGPCMNSYLIKLSEHQLFEGAWTMFVSRVYTYICRMSKIIILFYLFFQHLLSSSMDKTVRLWHLSSKSCLKIFSHSDYGWYIKLAFILSFSVLFVLIINSCCIKILILTLLFILILRPYLLTYFKIKLYSHFVYE